MCIKAQFAWVCLRVVNRERAPLKAEELLNGLGKKARKILMEEGLQQSLKPSGEREFLLPFKIATEE